MVGLLNQSNGMGGLLSLASRASLGDAPSTHTTRRADPIARGGVDERGMRRERGEARSGVMK